MKYRNAELETFSEIEMPQSQELYRNEPEMCHSFGVAMAMNLKPQRFKHQWLNFLEIQTIYYSRVDTINP